MQQPPRARRCQTLHRFLRRRAPDVSVTAGPQPPPGYSPDLASLRPISPTATGDGSAILEQLCGVRKQILIRRLCPQRLPPLRGKKLPAYARKLPWHALFSHSRLPHLPAWLPRLHSRPCMRRCPPCTRLRQVDICGQFLLIASPRAATSAVRLSDQQRRTRQGPAIFALYGHLVRSAWKSHTSMYGLLHLFCPPSEWRQPTEWVCTVSEPSAQ